MFINEKRKYLPSANFDSVLSAYASVFLRKTAGAVHHKLRRRRTLTRATRDRIITLLFLVEEKLYRRNYPLIPEIPGVRAGTLLVERLEALALEMLAESDILAVKEILRAAGDVKSRLRLVRGEGVDKVEKILLGARHIGHIILAPVADTDV